MRRRLKSDSDSAAVISDGRSLHGLAPRTGNAHLLIVAKQTMCCIAVRICPIAVMLLLCTSLTDEMTRLRGRIVERGVDVGMEQKLSSLQHQCSVDIQSMQSQLLSLHTRLDEILAKNPASATALLVLYNRSLFTLSTSYCYLYKVVFSLSI